MTNIKVKTLNNGTYQGNKREVDVFVKACEDEKVTIEYFHKTQIFSTKLLDIGKIEDCGPYPDNSEEGIATEESTVDVENIDDDNSTAEVPMTIIILVVFVVVSVVVSMAILFIIRTLRQKKVSNTEVIDDNPEYGNDDTEDYNEGDTQVVDNNDYYE